MVTAETCEIVEFNEPAADFFAKMTSEDQFAHLRKKGGGAGGGKGGAARGGKGGGKTDRVEYEGGREPSAAFPERSSEAVPWSRDMERRILDMLANAQSELDLSIEQERKKAEERQKRLAGFA